MQIWQLLTLEFWMQSFLDAGAKERAAEFGPAREAASA